jgi:molybdenum cofactor cytidylyltransferase
MSKIAAIILAAGASTRMGTPKQLLQLQGQSLLRRIVECAIAANCEPIVVVLGAFRDQIQGEISNLPIQIVENHEWQTGMGSSIRRGIQALLNQNIEAAILLLCDQPSVSPQLIQQLRSLYYSTHSSIIASTYQQTTGVPALFEARLFPELIQLNQQEGAKKVIQRHLASTVIVDFPEGAIDLDTPQDYWTYRGAC